MLVNQAAGAAAPRRWFGARALGAVLLLAAFATILPHLGSGTELVRLRHALVLGDDLQPGNDWAPPDFPASYLQERVPPDPYFVDWAEQLGLAGLPDDWSRAVAISRHLLGSAPRLNGGPVQQDLKRTHRAIVERGDGYCGDFVRVFTALAGAAGMTVRPWSFSFDGFGGHGHIWVEIWNRQQQRWQLVDVFQNYMFTDGGSDPLSAWELRRALASASPTLRLHRLHPGVPPGWAVEDKAWDYLRRGLPQWYQPWGNNVFTVDAALPVRAFTGVSRALEQLGAIVAGVQPAIRMIAGPDNAEERAEMHALQKRLWLAGAMGLAGLGLVIFAPWVGRRERPLHQPQAPGQALASSLPFRPSAGWPRLCVVGPLPPPSGGMANQCEQLLRLLREEGADVTLVRTNAPYRPAWVGGVPVLRAGFRLAPYVLDLWRGIRRAQVVHVFANSGWAWHLLVTPALQVARLCRVPAIVNYRGGQADEFLSRAPRHVHRALAGAAMRVTPSPFLLRVFARHGLAAEVIPNIIDLARFKPRPPGDPGAAPHLIVTRNLEPIYDIPTALRAFALVRRRLGGARLTVAGSGPERAALERQAKDCGIADAVVFAGRIDNRHIADLYASADIVLNPTTADNMPISILEALASGVPVVSTSAGGIPDLVTDEQSALLVPVADAEAMASAVMRVLEDRALAERLRQEGLELVAAYAWPRVRDRWRQAYWRVCKEHAVAA